MFNPRSNRTGKMSDHRANIIRKNVGYKRDFSFLVEVNNFLRDPVSVMDNTLARHEIERQRNSDIGHSLIIRLSILGQSNFVKINADLDYSEDYIPPTLEKYKDNCSYSHRELSDTNGVPYGVEIVLCFSQQQLISLDNKIDIIENGMTIVVGVSQEKINDRVKYWKDRLRGKMAPENNHRSSGFVAVANDPDNLYQQQFFKFGHCVHEIEIDRNPREKPGIYIGLWNYLNEHNDPVENEIIYIPFEEAFSGKNKIGLKVHLTINDAKEEGKEGKEEKKWADKETKAKYVQQWVKTAAEFIKNILPTTLALGKVVFSFWRKSKGIP